MNTTFDPDDFEAVQAEARASVRRERAAHRLGLLLDKRPPAFEPEGALHPAIGEWGQRFQEGRFGALVIIGPPGTGKTWSLWRLAESLLRHGWDGRVEIAAAYDIKEAAVPPVDRERLDVWRDCDLLAIDDLGATRVSDWDVDHLHALIDKRWQHRRSTVLTGNDGALRGLVGERVASRLADGVTKVELVGADRRRAQ